MPTSSNSKLVSVTISGKLIEIFDELFEDLDLSTEAELFRIALKFFHKKRNEDYTLIDELHKKLDELNTRLEKLEKQ